VRSTASSTVPRPPAIARAAGVTDAEIAEVVGNLARNILTNYFTIIADTDNDFPVVTPQEHA
jgi:hypothetical protein